MNIYSQAERYHLLSVRSWPQHRRFVANLIIDKVWGFYVYIDYVCRIKIEDYHKTNTLAFRSNRTMLFHTQIMTVQLVWPEAARYGDHAH